MDKMYALEWDMRTEEKLDSWNDVQGRKELDVCEEGSRNVLTFHNDRFGGCLNTCKTQ